MSAHDVPSSANATGNKAEMEQAEYDDLAKFLREMSERFGETAFTDRRRLVSLLSDRMPDARRDIRIVGSAVDERIFESLARARPEQLNMEIERLGAKMENGLGIRNDVAVPIVRACAYGLSLGPLPSAVGAVAAAPVPADRSWVGDSGVRDQSWVGLSQPAGQATGHAVQTQGVAAGATPGGAAQIVPAKPMQPWQKWLLGGGAGLIALLVVLGIIGSNVPEPKPPIENPNPPPVVPVAPETPIAPTQPPYIPPPVQQPTQPIPQGYYGNEDYDFHIPPQSTLKSDVGTPTPLMAPGVTTVTTVQVMTEMQNNRRMVLIDALQNQHALTIRGAVHLPYAGSFGTFNDRFQSTLANTLNSLVQGHREVPLVFFCQGIRCWESYNAALRARVAGFPNVFWYRGGLAAWQEAGFPMQATQ